MEKFWISQYQENIPDEINMSHFSSLTDLFLTSCHQHFTKPAYENLGTIISYADLDKFSLLFAIFLQSIGLKKGDRIAIMLPNLIQYPVVLFGALRAGLVVVNTNPLYTADELQHQFNDSGAAAVIVLTNFAHAVEKALTKCPSIKHIITTDLGDMFPKIKRILVNAVVKYKKKLIPPYHLPKAIKFLDALALAQGKVLEEVSLAHNDIAFLQYTGGTTGISKGAVLTHGNMIANVEQAFTWISPLNIGSHDIIITALPLYHIFSLTANCLTFLRAGAKNILITNPRDTTHFIREIQKSGMTAITGVNTLFNTLLNHPNFKKVDFSKLKLALSGGMALQKSVAKRWLEITQSPVLEAYGLTETSPAVAINPMYLKEYNGSVGLPLPSTLVSIRDEEGKPCPINEPGELCVKGPQVMQGYWNRTDETNLVFWADGFLRTGDIAKMDAEGFIYLVDRKKDMILVSGFNVYPNEIEQVIGMHPDVQEVGVVGVADEESGERVKACIVRKNNSLTEEDIIKHCRQHLTAYKIPKLVEFYNELPKTNVGKILRRGLR